MDDHPLICNIIPGPEPHILMCIGSLEDGSPRLARMPLTRSHADLLLRGLSEFYLWEKSNETEAGG